MDTEAVRARIPTATDREDKHLGVPIVLKPRITASAGKGLSCIPIWPALLSGGAIFGPACSRAIRRCR
jgi:hypothetical protein